MLVILNPMGVKVMEPNAVVVETKVMRTRRRAQRVNNAHCGSPAVVFVFNAPAEDILQVAMLLILCSHEGVWGDSEYGRKCW